MIDLSTLIALLTALASATSPQPPDSSARPPDPPSRSCAAPTPDGRASLVLDDSLDRPTASPRAGSSATRARPSDSAASDDDDRTDGRPDQKSPDRKVVRPLRRTPSDTDDRRSPTPSARGIGQSGSGDEPSRAGPAEPDRRHQRRRVRKPRTAQSDRRTDQDDRTTRPPDHRPRRPGSTAGPPPTDRPRARPHVSRLVLRRIPAAPAPVRPTTALRARAGPRPQVPGDLVDLANWYLTLPTGADGDPDTVQPDRLADLQQHATSRSTEDRRRRRLHRAGGRRTTRRTAPTRAASCAR